MVLDASEAAIGREQNEVISALENLTSALKAVEVYRPTEKAVFDLSLLPQATHVRLRLYEVVITVSAACVASLRIGNITRTFNFVGADAKVFPLPLLVDRGQDMVLTFSAGVGSGYFTYTPE